MPKATKHKQQVWCLLCTNDEDSNRETVWKKPWLYSTLVKAKRGIRGWTSIPGQPDCWYAKDGENGHYVLQLITIDK